MMPDPPRSKTIHFPGQGDLAGDRLNGSADISLDDLNIHEIEANRV